MTTFTKLPTKKRGLIYSEYRRLIPELEIARCKLMVFDSAIFQAYNDKTRRSISSLADPLICPIKLSVENRMLHDLKGSETRKIQDLYHVGIGYKIFPNLGVYILEKSNTDRHGLLKYEGSKKPGFSPLEHENAGSLLQSVIDLYHHYHTVFRLAYPNDNLPAEICLQQQSIIRKAQKKMTEVFFAGHPDLPKEKIEQTYLREKHTDHVFLNGSFTDLRPFVSLIRNTLRVVESQPSVFKWRS